MQPIRRFLRTAVGVLALISPFSSLAQTPAAPPVTTVLVNLTVRDGVTRDQIMKVMQTEIRETVQLYLDGKIQQWYSKGDGRGVMFLMNARTVDEAKVVMEALPLYRDKLVTLDYTALGPLMPMRLLLAPAASTAAQRKE